MLPGPARIVLRALVLLVILPVAAPAAGAAPLPRVVAPGATRTSWPCVPAAPCRLQWAVETAASGETVQLLPGTYDFVPEAEHPLQVPAGVTVERLPGGRGHPLIEQATPFASCSCATVALAAGSVLRDIDVTQAAAPLPGGGWALRATLGSVVERAKLRGVVGAVSIYEAEAKEAASGGLRDTLALSEDPGGAESVAVSVVDALGTAPSELVPAGAHLDNVTAIAHGPGGVALRVEAAAAPASLTATNTLAHGDRADVKLRSPEGEPATVPAAAAFFEHSALRSAAHRVREGGNSVLRQTRTQTGEPLFAGPGDYREAYGSPTLDAGAPDNASGPYDLAGEPRVSGAAVDIGAYEFPSVPPGAGAGAAASVTATSVMLSGSVNLNGSPGAWYVNYGASTLYGQRSRAATLGPIGAPTVLSTTVSGLSPSTTYHFQVVAVDPFGEAAGADGTFTTLRAPTVLAHPAPAPQDGLLRLSPARFRAAARGASFASATGTTVSWIDDQPARSILAVLAPRAGRDLFGTCIAPPRRTVLKLRQCTRWVTVASLVHGDDRGANRVRFSGRAAGRRLAPGRYRMSVQPSLFGRTGPALQASFTIVAR